MTTSLWERGGLMRRIGVAIAVVVIVAALLVWISWDPDVPNSLGQPKEKGLPGKQASKSQRASTSAPTSSSAPQIRDGEPPIQDVLVVPVDEKWVDAILKIRPLEWRKELVNTIRNESVAEMIAHLAWVDDMHLAVSSCGFMVTNIPDSRVQMVVLSRLSRVRRLLELGRENPQDVVLLLKDALREAMTDWQDARREIKKLMEQEKVLVYSKPPRYNTLRMQSIAATYLLGELGEHDALPMLVESFRLSLDPEYLWGVPSGMTLYAMHRLMSRYPENMLDPEGVRLREEYLESATQVLPSCKEIPITKWSSNYQESDPRIQKMDPKRVVLGREPRTTMPLYPWTFVDGTGIEIYAKASPKAMRLFKEIERFVNHVGTQP